MTDPAPVHTALEGAKSGQPQRGVAAISVGRLLWFGLGIAGAALLVLTVGMTLQSHRSAVEAARTTIQNIVLVLDQHAAHTIDAVDALLRVAADESGNGRVQGRSADALADLVAKLADDQPHVRAASLLRLETGQPISRHVRTDDPAPALFGAIEREAVLAHRSSPGLGLHVGRPFRDEARRTWLVGLSRRGETVAGTSVLIVAHVDLSRLQRFYEKIDVGALGSVGLYRADGVLLARKPYDDVDVGRSLSAGRIFGQEIARAASGIVETTSAVDGRERLIAYRRVEALPLVVTASVARDEVLAPWRAGALRDVAATLLALVALAVLGVRLTREAARRDRAEAGLIEKSAMLEATLENMDQGLMVIDADGTVPLCNRQAIRLLDLPPALMAARPSFVEVREHQLRTGEFGKSSPGFRAWVAQQGVDDKAHAYERERPNGDVLEVRTIPLAGGGAVRTFTDITERKQAEARIAHLAHHDALTDLPNRLLLRERLDAGLSRVRRHGGELAVLCLDLDRFKPVNDTLGHGVGDALLRAVAARVAAALGPEDTLARLGGDEFAVVQIGGEQPRDASLLAERLVELVAQPFEAAGHGVNVGVSIGVAVAPGDGEGCDALLRSADLALYRAKADGRGVACFFEAAMDASIRSRRAIEADLRGALPHGELELHYQPIANVEHGRVTGFEALLRWRHPERGMISPADFVPLAEETGLIAPIGAWVLHQACAEAAGWPDPVRVAVNLSPAQFRRQNIVETVLLALASSGLPANRLELEITESVLMQDDEATLGTLHRLRALGVRIALDDFGTGYSSLSYLRKFPFDKIKIDRSFVAEFADNPDCAAIVRAITALGASLGIATTAEGVETEGQLAMVRAQGCVEMQGYLLSRPRPASELAAFMPSHRRTADAA